MLLHIPAVLEPAVARQYLLDLENTAWEDGARTAGFQSALVKHNRQLPADSAVGRRIAAHIEQQLLRHPLFISAALPARIFPMLFNRYSAGDAFGMHVDNAIRYPPGETRGLRTDLSATLFLCEPAQYDGGELVIRDTYGEHSVKLPAGHMVLYPATSLHRVTEVTRGRASRPSSGCRAWCAMTASAPCSSSWMAPSRRPLPHWARAVRRPSRSRASTITCCAGGPTPERQIPSPAVLR